MHLFQIFMSPIDEQARKTALVLYFFFVIIVIAFLAHLLQVSVSVQYLTDLPVPYFPKTKLDLQLNYFIIKGNIHCEVRRAFDLQTT